MNVEKARYICNNRNIKHLILFFYSVRDVAVSSVKIYVYVNTQNTGDGMDETLGSCRRSAVLVSQHK